MTNDAVRHLLATLSAAGQYSIQCEWDRLLAMRNAAISGDADARDNLDLLADLVVAQRWRAGGFVFIELSDDLAFSLMATKVQDVGHDLRLPFDSFLIVTPEHCAIHVELAREAVGPAINPINVQDVHRRGSIQYDGIADLLNWSEESSVESHIKQLAGIESSRSAERARLRLMMGRLIVGVAIEMQTREHVRRRPRRLAEKIGLAKRYPIQPWVITRPVKSAINCADYVREYIARGGRAPAVEYMRCGHWSWQWDRHYMARMNYERIGPDDPEHRLGRYKWIPPTRMNGNKNLPIAVRPTVIEDNCARRQ